MQHAGVRAGRRDLTAEIEKGPLKEALDRLLRYHRKG
jgi:hypothetical protein